jgi:23S rRNA pseudouridine2605 synthase
VKERLQKILAARGVASRRAAEQIVSAGRVSVNGETVAELGAKADPLLDVIRVDGRVLPERRPPKVLMLHKPVGYVSTCRKSREEGRIILDLLPDDRRYFPVGRLDRDSSGLLLLTDDGDLANHLTHPRYGTRKVYVVETHSRLSPAEIRMLRDGVMLDDGLARAERVMMLAPNRLRITMTEGRKREIRRMIIAVGGRVASLTRVQIGDLSLGSLPSGEWRELNPNEIERLLSATVMSDRK